MNPFRFWHIAWNDLRYGRWRALLMIAGVGVVVAVFFTLSSIAGGLGSVVSATPASERNLVLIDKGATDYCQGQIPEAIVETLRRYPGVARVVPMLHTALRWKGQMVLIRAIEPEAYGEMAGLRIVEGKLSQRANSVIAGEQLARQNGWQVGDTLEIGGQELKLAGIFQAGGTLNSELWTSLEDGQRLLSRGDSYSAIVIQATPDADVRTLKNRLAGSTVLARETDIGTEPEVYETMNRSFGQEGLIQAGLGFAVGLAAGVAALAYLNATSAVSFLSVPLTLSLTPQTALVGGALTATLTLASAWLAGPRVAAMPVAEVLRGA